MTLPRHIAIIMDGNGRWAKQRHLPRVAGHKVGVDAVRSTVKYCVENNIEALTIFAFSSENWRRPEQEVSYLMELFIYGLQRETKKLHKENVQMRFIGDRSQFNEKLRNQIEESEQITAANTGLKFIIAANYGGQWDITEACRQIAIDVASGNISPREISSELIRSKLALADVSEPDLFIRTSGEKRISNFMIWQLAYTELYFTDVLWPDFNEQELIKAIDFFSNCERRFGCISEQLATVKS